MQKKFQRDGEKSEGEPAKPLKKQDRHFFSPEIFFFSFRAKKYGTISKQSKKAKNAKEAKIAEATKNRSRLAEREAAGYNQVPKKRINVRMFIICMCAIRNMPGVSSYLCPLLSCAGFSVCSSWNFVGNSMLKVVDNRANWHRWRSDLENKTWVLLR